MQRDVTFQRPSELPQFEGIEARLLDTQAEGSGRRCYLLERRAAEAFPRSGRLVVAPPRNLGTIGGGADRLLVVNGGPEPSGLGVALQERKRLSCEAVTSHQVGVL
jgi:hypothetical protein